MTIKSSTKFKIGIAVIIFAAVGAISLFFYQYVKRFYIEETYRKTDLVLGYIDATIAYVREELRPKMIQLLPRDDFVRQAMSSSFMNKGVMTRFTKEFPGYVHRRVAIDPLNPANKADAFETDFIRKFSADRNAKLEWKGLISKQGQTYFIHLKGVIMEQECEACHGNPSETPPSIIDRYGALHGHNWKLGDVIGLESIAVPMGPTFSRIRQVAFSIFCVGLMVMLILSFTLNYFYYVVTQRPMEKASAFFRSIASGERGLDVQLEVKSQDEIAELAESFNRLTAHLRKSQRALMASELKYRGIFQGSKDAIVVADRDGLILDVNRSGLELMNFSDIGEMVGQVRIHDFFASRELPGSFIAQLDKFGFVRDYETIFKRRDDAEINVLITATRGKMETGGAGGYGCIIRNITQRKKMEQRLKQADRLASIGLLAAGVAHEINNPLSIVLGYTKLLREDASEGPLKEDLGIIYNNAAACKKIVEDLLNFSRQTETRRLHADIRETIESVLSSVEADFAKNDIALARDYDPEIPLVAIDSGKIRQVCMNLVMNARQAMSAGGLITVSTRSDPTRRGFFITVADTGTGISPSARDRIFDPFFTTKETGQGTGLGLTVSYGIVEEHGGAISFESKEGEGTAFKIWLPMEVEEK